MILSELKVAGILRSMPTNTASRMMDDIEPALLVFLQEKVNSFVKWDLVRFFHDNPHAADTVENIARYTGRVSQQIGGEVTELVQAGVLEQQAAGNQTIYTLSRNAEMRKLIRSFVLACDDRNFRVWAISQVIRSMR